MVAMSYEAPFLVLKYLHSYKSYCFTIRHLVAGCKSLSAIINILQGDRVILLFQKSDHRLQFIAAFSRHAQGIALNLWPHFRIGVTNMLADLFCQFLRETLLQLDNLAHFAA